MNIYNYANKNLASFFKIFIQLSESLINYSNYLYNSSLNEYAKKFLTFTKSYYVPALLNFWLNFHKWIFSVDWRVIKWILLRPARDKQIHFLAP